MNLNRHKTRSGEPYKVEKGYLYLLVDVTDNRFFKVGRTINLKKRLAAYNSSFHQDKMYYLYTTELLYDVVFAEKILLEHLCQSKYYKQVDGRSEWFSFYKKSKIWNASLKRIIRSMEGITDVFYEHE